MRELERLIEDWRGSVGAGGRVGDEALDELESHLRESVDALRRGGTALDEAFGRAVAQLGEAPAIASEFAKLKQPLWWPAKVVVGIVILLTIGLPAPLFGRLHDRPSGLLLASHVLAVTIGYTVTLLVGGLGFCLICRRSVGELSVSRTRALARVSFRLGVVALVATAVAVMLGMFWANAKWGRYWAWDLPETGGFCVIVWQVAFLLCHRLFGGHAGRVLALGLLGNVVVTLAWFGPRLSGGILARGTADGGLLLIAAAVALHLLFFLIGFAPAGWLRPRKTAG
jgi:hypothetical protein